MESIAQDTWAKVGKPFTFSERPFLVYWEMTRACDLACRHCRAEAVHHRNPLELGTAEGKAMLRRLCDFGRPLPHLVLTGGDVLYRPDLFELVEYASSLGLGVSVSPSATNRLDSDTIARFVASGIKTMSLSLDGATPRSHDAFRGVPGCFDETLRAAHRAREQGLPLQINTLVAEENVDELPEVYSLVGGLGITRWSLFFLINVGRGQALQSITPARCERLFHWLYDCSRQSPFAIKATEALHFRRVFHHRMRAEHRTPEEIRQNSIGQASGVRDGNGIVFISYVGEVYPSGFLPLSGGNVRLASPVDIYRGSHLFQSIRDPDAYLGKCGRCEFRYVCGGSRARAFAATGDPLETDPLCPYKPRDGEVIR